MACPSPTPVFLSLSISQFLSLSHFLSSLLANWYNICLEIVCVTHHIIRFSFLLFWQTDTEFFLFLFCPNTLRFSDGDLSLKLEMLNKKNHIERSKWRRQKKEEKKWEKKVFFSVHIVHLFNILLFIHLFHIICSFHSFDTVIWFEFLRFIFCPSFNSTPLLYLDLLSLSLFLYSWCSVVVYTCKRFITNFVHFYDYRFNLSCPPSFTYAPFSSYYYSCFYFIFYFLSNAWKKNVKNMFCYLRNVNQAKFDFFFLHIISQQSPAPRYHLLSLFLSLSLCTFHFNLVLHKTQNSII